MQKIIVHIMNKKWFNTDTFKLELKLFKEVYNTDKIENFLFYRGTNIEDKKFEEKLSKD